MDETDTTHPDAAPEKAPEATGPTLREGQPRFTDSYGLVLVLLIVTYFVAASAGDHRYGRALMLVTLAATTWLALRTSHVGHRVPRTVLALIIAAIGAGVVSGVLGGEETSNLVSASFTAILVIVAPVAIARHLASHQVVNLNTFYGAICVYLLIAMFFATAFALLAAAGGRPFFAQDIGTARTIDYLYFSLTTITTVGYGDLTAQGNIGRIMAVLEAVLGQLYLITVVALVVQNLGHERKARGKVPS